jgi:hypothetical protein
LLGVVPEITIAEGVRRVCAHQAQIARRARADAPADVPVDVPAYDDRKVHGSADGVGGRKPQGNHVSESVAR